VVAAGADAASEVVLLGLLLLALPADKLLCVQVRLVHAALVRPEQTVVHLGFHLTLLA